MGGICSVVGEISGGKRKKERPGKWAPQVSEREGGEGYPFRI
jgi:hypothetical protein